LLRLFHDEDEVCRSDVRRSHGLTGTGAKLGLGALHTGIGGKHLLGRGILEAVFPANEEDIQHLVQRGKWRIRTFRGMLVLVPECARMTRVYDKSMMSAQRKNDKRRLVGRNIMRKPLLGDVTLAGMTVWSGLRTNLGVGPGELLADALDVVVLQSVFGVDGVQVRGVTAE